VAINTPNFTQIPNELLGDLLADDEVQPGLMATLENSQVKVFLAVCRLTFGYHRAERRASITMIQKLTGLSRQGVINAANALERADLIERSRAKRITVWRVKVVNSVGQSGQLSWPEESTQLARRVNSVGQTGQLSLPRTSKETINKPETKKSGGGDEIKDDFVELSALYTTEFGGLATRNVLAILRSDLEAHGLPKIRWAVDIAIANDKRVWSYVQGILKRQASTEFPVQQELPEQPELTPLDAAWLRCKSHLRMQMTEATFQAQIAPCEISHTANGNYKIIAPSAMVAEVLDKRLRGVIERTLSMVLDETNLSLEFLVKTEEQS